MNKLCALLSRSELRDLQDVRALLDTGGDLARALRDAPHKDGGFSPLTLAWVLRSFPVRALARALGSNEGQAADLERFRDELTERILAEAVPQ